MLGGGDTISATLTKQYPTHIHPKIDRGIDSLNPFQHAPGLCEAKSNEYESRPRLSEHELFRAEVNHHVVLLSFVLSGTTPCSKEDCGQEEGAEAFTIRTVRLHLPAFGLESSC